MTVTLTGTFEDSAGTPESGRVIFALATTDSNGVVIVTDNPVGVILDANGAFSLDLQATDELVTSGNLYHVTERLNGRRPRSYYIELPADTDPANLADLIPIAEPPNVVYSATLAQSGWQAGLAAHVADTTDVHGIADTAALMSQSTFGPGRRWLFIGDSIVDGSGASNIVYGFAALTRHMVGTAYMAGNSVNAGTAGYTSAQCLTYLPTLLSTYTDVGGVVIAAGTNDAGQSVTLATYQANITAMVALCKARSIPVVVCTVPPRGAAVATSTTRRLSAAYNTWLRQWAPFHGCALAERHTPIADATTGDLAATYDTGDGVHPSDAGHIKLAQACAEAVASVLPPTRPSMVGSVVTRNLVTNPLMAGTTTPTDSYGVTATGTTPVQSLITDRSDTLTAGRWAEIDLTAAADSVYRRGFTLTAGSEWAVGDVLVMTGRIQVVDHSGDWETTRAAATSGVQVYVRDASSGVTIKQAMDNNPGLRIAPGVYSLGPFWTRFTVGSGVTSLAIVYGVTVPNGSHYAARFGELGVFNATAMGLTTEDPDMVAVDGT